MKQQDVKIVQVLAPLADRFNGSPDTKVVQIATYSECLFIINMGANTGAAGRIKIYAFADRNINSEIAAKYHKQAIGYWYRAGSGSAPDTEGAWTRVEAGAEVTLAAAKCVNTQCLVAVSPVEASAIMQAAGYEGGAVHLNLNEAVDDPIVGSVTCVLAGGISKDNLPGAYVS
jgi:hypothetical protein